MNRIFNLLLQKIYYLLYHSFAWTYDWVAAVVSCGRWEDWLKATLPYLPGPKVLELGHGPGHLQAALYKKRISIVGIDASKSMCRLAKGNLLRQGVRSVLVNGYAQCIGLKSGYFDQVVATFPSDYIFHPLTLAEARRVLKPNGKLIILLGAWNTGRNLCQRLTGWLMRNPGVHALDTSQRYLEPFINAGFSTKIELIDQMDSRLVIIRADRC